MCRFINTELKSDSESSDSDSEKIDNELKSDSDNDSEWIIKTPQNSQFKSF